jgi:hypothetical protein
MCGGYEYEVALSFAGEDRTYVDQVATGLKSRGVPVFYDRFEQVALWGKDLVEHLDEVYRKKARFCVVFLSKAYKQKLWTNHERKSALARAFQERSEYILPVRFDDTEIPGILPTTGFIDLKGTPPEHLTEMLMEKLGRQSSSECRAGPAYRVPRAAAPSFNPYEQSVHLMNTVAVTVSQRCNELSGSGISATVFGHDRERSIRVVLGGKTAYSLDMRLDETFGDAGMTFYGVEGSPISGSNSHNAFGRIIPDPLSKQPAISLYDMSLFRSFGGETVMSFDEFTEAVWEKVCDAIERRQG